MSEQESVAIERHYTLRQVSKQLNVSTRTLRRWIEDEKLKAVKMPGRWGGEYRIPESEIERMGFSVIPDKESKEDK